MGFGAKVSQKGFDVLTCADYQLLYHSDWPLLKLEVVQPFTVNRAVDTTIYTHGLGFVPFFVVYEVDPATGGARISNDPNYAMDGTSIKYQGSTRGFGGTTGSRSGYVHIFRLNLATAFTAPIYNSSPASPGGSGNYGLKITKAGFDVSNTDLRNFAIHSDTRSPHIHKVGQFSLAGVGSATITHSLGYPPMTFFFGKITSFGDSRWQMIQTADDSFVGAGNTTAQFTSFYAGDYAYVIFKDPFTIN